MTSILRFVGILNAAIWLGGAAYFTFVAGQMPFSAAMQDLLKNAYPYYSGAIAQIGVARYFTFLLFCNVVALVHLAAEWLYQDRRNRRFLLGLVGLMLALTLVGGFWMQPKMRYLHRLKYAVNYPQPAQEVAAKSFARWHAVSMTLNLFMLGGLVIYTVHMSRPVEVARFVRPVHTQFRS
jgi:hypothetical protein